MDLIISRVKVDQYSIQPTIIFDFEFEYVRNWEIPVSFNGELKLNGTKLASMTWVPMRNSFDGYLTYPENERYRDVKGKEDSKTTISVSLCAELSPNAIAHIEKQRSLTPEKSITFEGYVGISILRSECQPNRDSDKPTWHRIRHYQAPFSYPINQSVWVNSFAAPLGIGKFMLVELRMLESPQVPESWVELFQRTQLRLRETEACIKQGEWEMAMHKGRQVFDNLKIFDKNKPEHKILEADFDSALKLDNHTDEGIAELKEAIKKLHQFGSKFVHDSSRTGIVSPAAIVATKEDAYLMYSLGLSILNLLSSKLHRLAEKQPK